MPLVGSKEDRQSQHSTHSSLDIASAYAPCKIAPKAPLAQRVAVFVQVLSTSRRVYTSGKRKSACLSSGLHLAVSAQSGVFHQLSSKSTQWLHIDYLIRQFTYFRHLSMDPDRLPDEVQLPRMIHTSLRRGAEFLMNVYGGEEYRQYEMRSDVKAPEI